MIWQAYLSVPGSEKHVYGFPNIIMLCDRYAKK